MPNRILRLRTVLDRTGLSRSTLYRKIGEGTFPQQLRISVRGAGWSEAEVEQWVADPAGYRIDARPPQSQMPDARRSGTTLSETGAKQ